MKITFKLLIGILAVYASSGLNAAHALLVDDVIIESITGSDTNRAFFVIDFDETGTDNSFTFEYRWDPNILTPTGWDMLSAIDVAESDLIVDSGGAPGQGFGVFINDVTYKGFSRGAATTGEFWAYWNAEGADPDLPNDWVAPFAFGISGRILSDLSWDGLSIPFGPSPDFASPPAPDVAAVPLPASAWLLLSAIVFVRRLMRS